MGAVRPSASPESHGPPTPEPHRSVSPEPCGQQADYAFTSEVPEMDCGEPLPQQCFVDYSLTYGLAFTCLSVGAS